MKVGDGVNQALKVIGVTGFEGISVVAPSAIRAVRLVLNKFPAEKTVKGKVLRELKRQGLVQIEQNNNSYRFTLTPAGVHRLQKVLIEEITIPLPKKWDKKWRVVTFDVPIRQSAQRASLTKHLQKFGFVMLQKSLWFYPYPCFAQVEKVAGYYNVLRYCTFMEVTELDELSERRLAKTFPAI